LTAASCAVAGCAVPRVRAPGSLAGRLAAIAVADDDFYRPVHYTWTTPANLAALRASERLLVATARTGGFTSAFIHAATELADTDSRQGELAGLLVGHPALLRRRYAWPAPFATVMGIGTRTYGTTLIRIELRPEAWIGRFEPAAERPLSFVDADRRAVPFAAVAAAPERIGAVFHVHADPAYREYVICSEAMVARWSIATPAIRDTVDAELALLRALRDTAGFAPAATERAARDSWREMPAGGVEPLWHAALAFDNDRYRARGPQLAAIIAALEAYEAVGAPLEVVPRQAAAYSPRRSSHSASPAT